MDSLALSRELTGYLSEKIDRLEKELKAKNADIERLTLDVAILTEELERERRPKCDER
jgi:archaellum component FlaC